MDTGLRTHPHRFELSGGAIAKCRMTTGAIVEHFDPFKNILSGLFSSEVAPMIHELRFQRMKEAFDLFSPNHPRHEPNRTVYLDSD